MIVVGRGAAIAVFDDIDIATAACVASLPIDIATVDDDDDEDVDDDENAVAEASARLRELVATFGAALSADDDDDDEDDDVASIDIGGADGAAPFEVAIGASSIASAGISAPKPASTAPDVLT